MITRSDLAELESETVQPDTTIAIPPQSGDLCAACGAALAPDQRYCLQCGARLGQARSPAVKQQSPALVESTPLAPNRSRRPKMSADSTLIAGIGTLLLALGVGVLIGRSGNSSSTKTGAPQVLTIPSVASAAPGTGATGAAAATPATTAATAASAASSSKTAKAKPPPVGAKLAPVKGAVKIGSKGSGPGYQGGKFTGNFFGG